MPELFARPPHQSGPSQLPKDNGPLKWLDLLGEGILSPLGLSSPQDGLSDANKRSLTRAGAVGDLASMLVPLMGAGGLLGAPKGR